MVRRKECSESVVHKFFCSTMRNVYKGDSFAFLWESYFMLFVKCGWSESQGNKTGQIFCLSPPLWYGYLTFTLPQVFGSVCKLCCFQPCCDRARNKLMFLQEEFDFFDHDGTAYLVFTWTDRTPSCLNKLLTTQITCRTQLKKLLWHS